jgi:hypothetical protein
VRLTLEDDLVRDLRLPAALLVVAPLLRQIERETKRQRALLADCSTDTAIWQLPIWPSVPEYCRFTPGECRPSLRIPVSSITQAVTPISGATRSTHACTNSAGSHGESARNCCIDS